MSVLNRPKVHSIALEQNVHNVCVACSCAQGLMVRCTQVQSNVRSIALVQECLCEIGPLRLSQRE
jgi:hypothetical protein